MTEHTIQGPKGGIFGLPSALAFQSDPLGFLTRAAHDYDDIIHFAFGQRQVYLITHPDYIHEALVKHYDKLTKWSGYQHISEKAWGKALINYEGEEWKQERRLVSPAFHVKRIRAYRDLMVRHTCTMFERWKAGGEFELDHEMTTVTMGIICEILFDIKDIEQDAAEVSEALTVVLDMFIHEGVALFPVPDWVPTPRNLRENRAMKVTDQFISGIIAERRKSGEDRGDVLSALLHAVDEGDGVQLTDQQVRDELMGLFIAGHETTATALTWALYLLAKHPEIQQKLYEHVAGIVKGDGPTLDDLTALTYTNQVVMETLRLYPPAWSMFIRDVHEDLIFGELTVPKGGILYISPWVMHHDPRYWQDPQRFDPDRFEGEYSDRLPKFAYLPFGGGPRVCAGNHMAMMEAQIILAMMVEQYQFEPLSDREVLPDPRFTVHPKNGLHLKVTKR